MQFNPVVHFEMQAKDNNRVARFYETAFNWKMQQLGPEMNHYILAITSETDANGMNKTPGTINGGFYKTPDVRDPTHGTHIVISVSELEKHIELVKQAGGQIIGEIMDIPTVGRYVSFNDSEGNVVGMLQPIPKQA